MPRSLKPSVSGKRSRLRRFAQNHLGVIMGEDMNQVNEFRDPALDLLDKYYDNEQYDGLIDWQEALKYEEYVPIRDRKPRIIYNVAKMVVDKVAGKLVGEATFPKFLIEDDDDDTAFFRTVTKAVKFRRSLIDPIKHMLISGAVFARYYFVNGVPKIEYAKSKYCYPAFDETGELDSVLIKYTYEDSNDRTATGTPQVKWYQIQLTKQADILFDNPIYRPGVRPDFTEVSRNEHGLGWVQGEWFVTHSDKFDFDGYGIFSDILGFIDELNYSLSQSSQASSYNQEPQLVFNKMDEDEIDKLVKSSTKAWNLGREGEGKYLETDMKGVSAASELREKYHTLMMNVVRVVIHDPEKMSGSAQSADALKQLMAPLIELVDELRTVVEPTIVNLLIKIGMTALHYNALGEQTNIVAPDGYMPSSLDVTVQWPAIVPATLADINVIATACSALSMANVVSRESLTRWIAASTPIIDNPDEELKKIAAQPPPPNPFGDGGGGFGGQ